MDGQEARRRFAAAPVAHLATVRPDGRPHIVPITFALVGEVIYTAVDTKPKATRALQRLTNLRYEPRCAVLVDRYDEDWSALWWVRADGRAEILPDPSADPAGVDALAARYPRYRTEPPPGPLIRITVERWRWWAAVPPA